MIPISKIERVLQANQTLFLSLTHLTPMFQPINKLAAQINRLVSRLFANPQTNYCTKRKFFLKKISLVYEQSVVINCGFVHICLLKKFLKKKSSFFVQLSHINKDTIDFYELDAQRCGYLFRVRGKARQMGVASIFFVYLYCCLSQLLPEKYFVRNLHLL